MSDIFEQLSSPFDPSEVDWRVGSTSKKNPDKPTGMALAYVDARTVMDRLDTVCGPAGWQNRYVMEGSKTVCEIGIKCGDEWVWKADGAGDSDIEAEKGALSDAFKRAAVRWGIGRYLYNLKSPWVPLKAFGNSFVIADEAKPQLDALLRGNMPKPPAQPKPEQPKRTPKSFVNDAIKAIGTLTDAAGLNAWVEANKADLERLREVYDEGARQVDGALQEQRKHVMRKVAAE
jgi:hypothetical protein